MKLDPLGDGKLVVVTIRFMPILKLPRNDFPLPGSPF
jgi:hypothetical protein